MPLLHENKKKERHGYKINLFTMTSGCFVIAVGYNSFIDSKKHFLEPTYLATILMALIRATGRILLFLWILKKNP